MTTKQELIDYINSLPEDSNYSCALRVLRNHELSITNQIPCPQFAVVVDQKAKNESVGQWDDFISNIKQQKANLKG